MAHTNNTQAIESDVTAEVEPSEMEMRQAVLAVAYRSADRAGKAAIRSEVNSEIKAAGKALDMVTWAAWQQFGESLVPEPKGKVEVDYQRLVAVHVQALRELAYAYESGNLRPEGTPEEFTFDGMPAELEDASQLSDEDLNEVSVEAARVHKAVRLISGTKAPKGNITAHVEEVFASVESGTFLTEAQIQRTSTEAYPEGTPKGGNVHASLFGSQKKVDAWVDKGIIPTEGNGTTPAGATKA